jgi:hypothetical protein
VSLGKTQRLRKTIQAVRTREIRSEIQDCNGQADMLAEEKACQHTKAMRLKFSVKAGKIATTHSVAEVKTQEKAGAEEKQVKERQTARARADADTQDQANKVESVSEEEQTARTRAKAEGRAEARRSNTKGIPSSVIEKRVVERAKLEDML